jgi:hypothetical protein
MASRERQRLAGSALDAAFWGQNIQYLPFSASLDAWAAETANAAYFLIKKRLRRLR